MGSIFKSVLYLSFFFILARPVSAGPYEDCLARGNSPTECRAAAGGYNQNGLEENFFKYNYEVNQVLDQTGGIPNDMRTYFGPGVVPIIMNQITRSIAGDGRPPQEGGSRGAAGFMASAIGSFYDHRPASSVDYVNNIAMKAGFPQVIKTAHAANPGIGFNSLRPVMALWELIRNITYLIFSVVFVVVGLMILLRVKIDPKTVISIQNALPRIIWSLVLITFSYPLAGFLIDLMYVSIGVILGAAAMAPGMASVVNSFGRNLASESIFGLMGADKWAITAKMGGQAIQGIVSALLGDVLFIDDLVSGGIGVLGGLIIAIAILYALFKTWLSLLGAYINILVGVILSPLAMLGEAIPGIGGFSMWIRAMLANLLAFPLVIILMLFGAIIMAYGNQGQMGGPSAAGGFVPPLLGGNNPSAITALIGLGILLMIPKAVEMLQEYLKSPPFKYGMAWQESTGVGARLGTAPIREKVYDELYGFADRNSAKFRGSIARSIIGFGADNKLWGPPPKKPDNA